MKIAPTMCVNNKMDTHVALDQCGQPVLSGTKRTLEQMLFDVPGIEIKPIDIKEEDWNWVEKDWGD